MTRYLDEVALWGERNKDLESVSETKINGETFQIVICSEVTEELQKWIDKAYSCKDKDFQSGDKLLTIVANKKVKKDYVEAFRFTILVGDVLGKFDWSSPEQIPFFDVLHFNEHLMAFPTLDHIIRGLAEDMAAHSKTKSDFDYFYGLLYTRLFDQNEVNRQDLGKTGFFF